MAFHEKIICFGHFNLLSACLSVSVRADLCVNMQHPVLNIAVLQNLKPRRQHLTSQNKQKQQLKDSLASNHADKASVRNKTINVRVCSDSRV